MNSKPNINFVKECIEKYRTNLVDTSKRNNLISFKHSERSRQEIRLIDELPDFLYKTLLDGQTLTFKSLPEANQIPPDEKTLEFLNALERAKLTDQKYLEAIETIDENEEGALDQIKAIERTLRNKIRVALELPIWNEQKRLTNAEIAEKQGINPSYEMPKPTPEHQQDASRHLDHFIQTLLNPEEMERKLSGLNAYIRSDIEESGVNTLYVAFGFLQWYESEASDQACLAPLLLLQLEMEKKQLQQGYTYSVQATGEEPEINLCLAHRLQNSFGIQLPEFTETDTPERYLDQVAKLITKAEIPKKDQWRIRRFITVGRFRFARLVMYHDLGEKKWPEHGNIFANKMIQNLFSGTDSQSYHNYADDYDIDTQEVEEAVPLLITATDASQHSTLVDVMKGKNLVIKGPPGTGKSQTITNIIACALNNGKTVLFLAEKMAALNVVYERLSKANLDSYCLELHSTKSKKTEVLKSIEKRLKLSYTKDKAEYLSTKIEEFKKHRDYITTYLDTLNSKFGRQDKTIHEYLWSAQLRKDRLKEKTSILHQIKIPFEQANLSEHELSAHTDELKIIVTLKKEVDKASEARQHPWFFITNFNLNPFQQDELKQLVGHWQDHLEKIQATLERFNTHFQFNIKPSASSLDDFLKKTENLVHWAVSDLDEALIAKLGNQKTAKTLTTFIENIHIYQTIQEDIHSLRDISSALDQIQSIARQAEIARELDVEHLSATDIGAQAETLEETLKLWDKNLKPLLNLGHRFGISQEENPDKICTLIDMLDYIASIPRDYLLSRNKEVIDENHAEHLKNAADKQKWIQDMLNEQNKQYDLSMTGQPQEIRMHAAIISNAGFFAWFDPAYRQAKKFFKLASKYKTTFNAATAAKVLRDIASAKEAQQKLEQDTLLQSICGASFNGFNTDFEKLQKINEWAAHIRKRYTTTEEYSHKIRQWLLTGDIDELDSFRELATNENFIALKNKISHIKETLSLNTPVCQYIDSLSNKKDKLDHLKSTLENVACTKDTTFADITEDLPQLHKAKEMKESVEQDFMMKSFFGADYAGINTNIQDIEQTVRFINDCLCTVEIAGTYDVFFNHEFSKNWHQFIEYRQSVKNLHETVKAYLNQIEALSPIDISIPHQADHWTSMSYADLIALLANALEKSDCLSQWVNFKAHLENVKHDLKGKLLSAYLNQDIDFETLPLAFEYIIYSAIACTIYTHYPIIRTTKGLELAQARTRIKALDEEISSLQQEALSNTLNKIKPLAGISTGSKKKWTEGAIINNELNKQKNHIPIRSLMKRAGQSIQQIKPCFLMSPLTVAQYLEPTQFTFDLMIIDEASQMRPEDALGGIARAKQIVVVGDPKQLPPSSFFQSTNNEDKEEDFNAEAIMDIALSAFRPPRILSRHYRSQHESLIAFSNYHFYDNSLLLFPSPVKNPDELGVKLEYVGGTYHANCNDSEVKAIVNGALNFMRKYPERSLGIVTMNKIQTDLIESEMDRAFIDHPHAKKYKDKWQSTLEPFFVKNLESVQGDERDAIFISTVYGPDKHGTVMQRFGPINRSGGYRRLNVLFTRAKKNMVIFTSLKPNDIKIAEHASQGIRALKGFLTYASTGIIDEGKETHLQPDSDFEIWVKEKLESIGCEAHPQVGVAGYRIDLGVKHPRYPHGYLMGIECDGANYHSSKSARERDIIRQQVLENLGWHIYRIWSTDWFANPTQEFEKLKTYIENLLNKESLSQAKENNKENNVAIAHDLTSEDIEEDEFNELCEVTEEPINQNNAKTVQLFDHVTYLVIKDGQQKQKSTVQIVPEKGSPYFGTINQHSEIAQALLDNQEGEEIECILPTGEVTLMITQVTRPS